MNRILITILILIGSAMAQTIGVPGTAKPIKAEQVAGTDGTSLLTLKTDANGQLITTAPTGASANQVQGTAATGAAPVGKPVLISGLDQAGNQQPPAVRTTTGILINGFLQNGSDGQSNNAMATTQCNTSNCLLEVGPHIFNGLTAGWDRLRSQSTTNSAAASQPGVLLADFPGQWAVFHAPAAATAATIGQAAAAGLKHVAKSATVCISAVAAQPDIIFNLRDGATGAGTIKWTWRLAATAGTSKCESSPPFTIIGTTNTAMTLESAAAPAATNFATVSISGYDIP